MRGGVLTKLLLTAAARGSRSGWRGAAPPDRGRVAPMRSRLLLVLWIAVRAGDGNDAGGAQVDSAVRRQSHVLGFFSGVRMTCPPQRPSIASNDWSSTRVGR